MEPRSRLSRGARANLTPQGGRERSTPPVRGRERASINPVEWYPALRPLHYLQIGITVLAAANITMQFEAKPLFEKRQRRVPARAIATA